VIGWTLRTTQKKKGAGWEKAWDVGQEYSAEKNAEVGRTRTLPHKGAERDEIAREGLERDLLGELSGAGKTEVSRGETGEPSEEDAAIRLRRGALDGPRKGTE